MMNANLLFKNDYDIGKVKNENLDLRQRRSGVETESSWSPPSQQRRSGPERESAWAPPPQTLQPLMYLAAEGATPLAAKNAVEVKDEALRELTNAAKETSLTSDSFQFPDNFSIQVLAKAIQVKPVREKKGGLSYACAQCKHLKKFDLFSEVIRHHLECHANEWILRCNLCGDNVLPSELANHLKRHLDCAFQSKSVVDLPDKKENVWEENASNDFDNSFGDDFLSEDDLPLAVNFKLELDEKPSSCGEPPTDEAALEFKRTKRKIKHEHIAKNRKTKVKKKMQEEKIPLECDVCKKISKTKPALEKHMQKHFKEHTCCSINFDSLKALSIHQSQEHRDFLCAFCGKTFYNNKRLRCHLLSHTNDKTYQCDQCDRRFSRRNRLKAHYRIHTGEKPYSCSICSKAFTSVANSRRHMLIHTGEKPYLCTFCGSAFNQSTTLKEHVRKHTGEPCKYKKGNEKRFECSECAKKFNSSAQVKIHMRVHTKERPYQCDFCPKTFSQVGALNVHLRKHSGVKPYKCHYCEKSYAHSLGLKYHIRTHTGEQPYKCQECSRAFSGLPNLLRHKLVHTGERPYACEYCTRKFAQYSALEDHINTHTGAKPYGCPHCAGCFANRSTLSRHIAIHTKKTPQ